MCERGGGGGENGYLIVVQAGQRNAMNRISAQVMSLTPKRKVTHITTAQKVMSLAPTRTRKVTNLTPTRKAISLSPTRTRKLTRLTPTQTREGYEPYPHNEPYPQTKGYGPSLHTQGYEPYPHTKLKSYETYPHTNTGRLRALPPQRAFPTHEKLRALPTHERLRAFSPHEHDGLLVLRVSIGQPRKGLVCMFWFAHRGQESCAQTQRTLLRGRCRVPDSGRDCMVTSDNMP